MKMLMSVLFALFLSFNVAFAADNNDKTETTEKATTEAVVTENEAVEAESKEKVSPEGIHCKKYSEGELIAECWFCNCSTL